MPVKYFYVFVAILSWKVDKVLIEVVIQSLAAAPQSGVLTITKSGTIIGGLLMRSEDLSSSIF